MALLSAWLEKRSTLGLWQRRFFLLEPDRLSYHSQRGELHSFPLHTISAVSRDDGEVAVAFAASSTTRELRMRALCNQQRLQRRAGETQWVDYVGRDDTASKVAWICDMP